MNLEELKAILQTIEKLGSVGQWAFGWYLAKGLFSEVLWYSFFVMVLVVVKQIVYRVRKDVERWDRICEILGIRHWSDEGDWDRFLKVINENREFIKWGIR